jgi:hypothetical protein
MTSAASTSVGRRPDPNAAVARLIEYLETGKAPDGLFASDVFADLSLPQWRIQTDCAADIIAVRADGHPAPGEVRVERIETTPRGFTIEFEERWYDDGQRWYCREMIRADVVDDSIVEMSIYCTGDWDEAKQQEFADSGQLIRP